MVDAVAGWVGGVGMVLAGHGFDTVKVRMQTSTATAMQVVRQIIQHEGVLGLYRGVGSPLAAVPVMNAVMIASYTWSTELFVNNALGLRQLNPALGDPAQMLAKDRLNLASVFAAGALTGAITSFVESPVDLFKSKAQMVGTPFRGPLHAFRVVLSNYGLRGMYQGLGATLIRNIPANASFFFTYEAIKRSMTPPGEQPSLLLAFMCGGFSGVVYWVSAFPLDLVKTTMQMDDIDPKRRKFGNFLSTVRLIAQTSGWRGFFRGLLPCTLRSFPANATMFLGVEATRSLLSPTSE